jgi:predicted dinucleotide-binding enzyme
MVNIGIIGTGGVGVALAKGWKAKGHTVVFGSRNPEAKSEVVEKIKNCKVTSIANAVTQSEVRSCRPNFG